MSVSFSKSWPEIVRQLGISTAIFLMVPLLFLLVYFEWLHAPLSVFGIHVRVVAWFAMALAGVRILISLLPIETALRRMLSSLAVGCVFFGFVALYSGVVVGVKLWGRPASLQLVSIYFSQAAATLRVMDISIYWVVGVAGLFALIVVGSAYSYLKKYDWALRFRESMSPITSGVVAASLLCLFSVYALSFENREWGAQGEPLSLALFPNQGDLVAQSHHVGLLRMAELQSKHDAARASYVPSAGVHKSNIIFIVVDALRADHLSLFGYNRKTSPGLERIRSEGAMSVATSAVAVCNESFCGLRGLASSQTVANQAEHPFSIYDVVRKYGYKVNLVLSGDHTNFYGLANMYGRVDSYFDGASQKGRYINDDRILLDRLNAQPKWDGTPTMFQFHLMSAHFLGLRLDETPEFGPGRPYGVIRDWSTSTVESANNYYDRGVLQADAVIGSLLERLKALGYLEDALVVVTGDHGESLGERGLYGHVRGVWEESLRVPFIVIAFGKADPVLLRSSEVISQIDIAPTVLQALGMKVPDVWMGAALQTPYSRRYIDFQQAKLLGLIDTQSREQYKFWVDTQSGNTFTYSLLSDRKEEFDISGKIAPELMNEWREHLKQQSGALPAGVQYR
ncbi:sulfatase-like hydrolase/transferase [Pseudomonas sp. PDM23]|uniref:sulfatase-like hydrolase/transferase n=1 Tax=unclassified Pseudomonas TaxID=196821 RepID=UPI0017840B94|nr:MULTISPECIES: sulfatase-like hydrolase/transferase [unclassified Pseudomonas]MBD9575817.1 sulfatase-like hydrolase/transferase [Pseudomonas sp. PDM23]MBD9669238.1 sulfatase-like hydrolase/transferase [Pseudomonas sp. PDM21]